jgi:predicted GIY-YIG superfamily endonuclease
MNEKFQKLIESLEPSFQRLVNMKPVKVSSLPVDVPHAGIYLFSENDKHLYVGRSNRIRQRLQEHCRPSSSHNTAPFAFRLAREATGKLNASYVEKDSRGHLESQPEFKVAFTEAKHRVGRMQVRFVSEADPLRQALIEMYVSICLETPYNDFDNH